MSLDYGYGDAIERAQAEHADDQSEHAYAVLHGHTPPFSEDAAGDLLPGSRSNDHRVDPGASLNHTDQGPAPVRLPTRAVPASGSGSRGAGTRTTSEENAA